MRTSHLLIKINNRSKGTKMKYMLEVKWPPIKMRNKKRWEMGFFNELEQPTTSPVLFRRSQLLSGCKLKASILIETTSSQQVRRSRKKPRLIRRRSLVSISKRLLNMSTGRTMSSRSMQDFGSSSVTREPSLLIFCLG